MLQPPTAGPRSWAKQEPKMTATFFNTVRKVSLVLALTTSFAAVSSTASFAFSSEAQQQCTGDAFRLCSSEIPNIPKITACMMKHRADLSVGCRGVMDRELGAQKSGKLAAQ
jgi:hypothetical protein